MTSFLFNIKGDKLKHTSSSAQCSYVVFSYSHLNPSAFVSLLAEVRSFTDDQCARAVFREILEPRVCGRFVSGVFELCNHDKRDLGNHITALQKHGFS